MGSEYGFDKMIMHIDTHCHLDLFSDPLAVARAYEGSSALCVMATMLPSHYQLALPHLKPFRNVWPALGMHPLRAREGQTEIALFRRLSSSVKCFGEIGLDFSTEGIKTKEVQLSNLKSILPHIGENKFITIHSRNAHEVVSDTIDEFNVGPVCFHYFIGGPRAAEKLVLKGHYFSINHRMLSGKHKYLIEAIPKGHLLVESDGPFLTEAPLSSIDNVYNELSKAWGIDINETTKIISGNFHRCRTGALS